MESLVINLLRGAGIAITPAIVAAIVACMVVKCAFNDKDCVDAAKECIEDIVGIKLD